MKMTNNKGFIQLPILIIAVLILAGGSFYVARNSINNHKSKLQLAAINQANITQNNNEGQILGEQNTQQGQETTQMPNEASTNREQASHKIDSKSQSVVNLPSQPKTQGQPAQAQPTQNQPATSPLPTLQPQTPTPQPTTQQNTSLNGSDSTDSGTVTQTPAPQPTPTPTPTPPPVLSSITLSLTSVTPSESSKVALGSTDVILATFNINVMTQPSGKPVLIKKITARLIGNTNVDIPISLYISNPTNPRGTGYLHTSENSTLDVDWTKQGSVQDLSFLFISSIPTNTSLANSSFKIRIETMEIIDPETGDNITVSGLPFESNTITLIDPKPHITILFNGSPSDTFTGKVGDSVNMSWEVQSYGGATCNASGDLSSWSGQKPAGGSQILTLDYPTGTFAYTLTCANRATGDTNSATASITVTP